MSVRRTGERSDVYWVVTVVVILVPGLATSWLAWSIATPFRARLREAGLPQEYVLLTCSLLCLYGAALVGGWVARRNRLGERWALSPVTGPIGAVTLYGLIAASVFALSTASEWSLAAVLPLGLVAYFHLHWSRSARAEGGSSRDGAPSASGGG